MKLLLTLLFAVSLFGQNINWNQIRNRPFFSVMDYGARGNGVANDAAALNNACASGRVVAIPAGTYIVGTNTTLSNCTLSFTGGVLSVSSGITLTINAKILPAQMRQIFSGSGTVVPNVGSAEALYPQWWGAMGDNSTNDLAAITATLTAANSGGIGVVRLPAGTYQVGNVVTVPNKVRLLGAGRGDSTPLDVSVKNTTIKAISGTFPVSTPVVQLCSTDPCFGVQVEDLTIDCASIAGCIGGKNNNSQEQSWFRRILVIRNAGDGFHLTGFANQNSGPYQDLEVLPFSAGVTTTTCFRATSISAWRGLNGITCNADGYTSLPTRGIYIDGVSPASISNVHVEHFENGVVLGSASLGESDVVISNVEAGPGTANAIVITTPVAQGMDNFVIMGVTASEVGANVLVDGENSITLPASGGGLGFYAFGEGPAGTATVISSRSDITSKFKSALTVLKNLYVSGSGADDGAISLGPSLTTFQFKHHDTSGFNLIRTPSIGALLQTFSGTQGPAGGGLMLNGGGFGDDPAVGQIGAGYTGDTGTLTARDTAASSVQFDNGIIDFLVNTGLTPGNTFAQISRWRIETTGILRNVTPLTFASLGTPTNGSFIYCSDCAVTTASDNTCAGSSTGALAVRINSVWRCFSDQAGGGGVSTGAALAAADFTPTRTSDTLLDFPAIAAGTYRVGEASCAAVAAADFAVTSGTGTLWIAVGSDCLLTVRHNIVGTCDANCTAVASSTGFLPSDLPLYQWTVTTDVLAATGTLKLTPYVSRPLVAGTNVSFGHTAGVTTINATGGGEIYTYDTTNSLYRFTCSNGAFNAAVGVYASLPTCTSGTIQAYSHGIAVTRPVAAASWTALQSATLADSVGAVTFAGTLNGKEFQGLARPVLTAPYTITLGMDVSAFGDQSGCTVGWSNGTAATSESHTLYIDFTSTSAVEKYVGVNRWNDLDIDGFVSADLTGVAYTFLGSTVFVKLEDNNTNRIYSISPNGIDWHELLSIARTTHITPTHFLAACYSATGLGKKGTLFHVVEDDQ